MTSATFLSSLLAVVGLVLAPSCTEEAPALGGACEVLPELFDADGVAIQLPTIECASRYCVAVAPSEPAAITKPVRGNCTEECDSDAECADIAGPGCLNGFVCAVPTVEGTFCCRSMCVCRDDLAQLPAYQPTPLECDAVDPTNTCQNLPGRAI